MIANKIQSALTVGLGVAAFAATIPAVYAQDAEGLEEVFVTARKRDEGVQAVPISIQALSADALEQRNVREVQDLNMVVPGFRFGSQGGKGTNDVIMRGLSKIPLGEGVPSVVTYFANVALPANGSNVPTFDIANIQVLKGPQGTLFGRNTLGGAVVIAPEAPDYYFGGYLRGAFGTNDYRVAEGAVNVPVVDDKVAVRFAGQTRRQDGLNRNLSGGPDFDDIHQNSYRISLLLNPTDNLESTTVYDHFNAKEHSGAPYMLRTNAIGLAGLGQTLGGLQGAGLISDAAAAQADLTAQINDYLDRGHRAGVHAAFSDLPDGGHINRSMWGVSNDTAWEGDSFTVRNIFGYRKTFVEQSSSSSGTGPLVIHDAVMGDIPFTLFDPSSVVNRKYLSDEFQVFGSALDDRLEWIVGLFYNKDESAGDNGTQFTAFSPSPAPAVTSHVENENKAIFAQTGWDLSDWVADGLKFNLGARYSEDDVWACGGSNGIGYMSVSQCKNSTDIVGVGIIENDGAEASWTVGLDYQITPDTMLYGVTRRGYRGVNVNTPLFESIYTTGVAPGAPDLRPFQKVDEEQITDFEVGMKTDWYLGDVKGRFNVAAYYTKYKDAVQFVNTQAVVYPLAPDSPNSGSVGVNAADLNIHGVEADLTIIPIDSLTLMLSGAYTDQDVDKVSNVVPGLSLTEDEITLPSPQLSGTFAFSWILPVRPLDGDLVFNGDYYYTDDFGGQNGESLPGYELTNFRLSWNDIAKTGLSVGAYVKNAFDEEYFSSPIVLLQSFPVSAVQVGERRTWGVEATYNF